MTALNTLSKVLLSFSTSAKSMSLVGRPGSSGLRTEPSGNTRRLNSSKSCAPGLSLTYTPLPDTIRAVACSNAAGCLEWNISQSGCEHTTSCQARHPEAYEDASDASMTVETCSMHTLPNHCRTNFSGHSNRWCKVKQSVGVDIY